MQPPPKKPKQVKRDWECVKTGGRKEGGDEVHSMVKKKNHEMGSGDVEKVKKNPNAQALFQKYKPR